MMTRTKKLFVASLFAGVTLCGVVACGGGSDDDDSDGGDVTLADANGSFDLTEADILKIFGAISAECSEETADAPDSIEECKQVCNCSASAIAQLEGKTESPILIERCEVACDPAFAATADLAVPADDEDELPEYERFFEAYIVKCDEIANRTVFTAGEDTQECIDTCICLSDSIEQYVSQTTDDNIRSQCESSCQPPPATATGKVLRPILTAGF